MSRGLPSPLCRFPRAERDAWTQTPVYDRAAWTQTKPEPFGAPLEVSQRSTQTATFAAAAVQATGGRGAKKPG